MIIYHSGIKGKPVTRAAAWFFSIMSFNMPDIYPTQLALMSSLVGEWLSNPHPSSLSRLVLCADGRGLLLIYDPSEEPPLYVDEFTWAVPAEGTLEVTWQLCHTYLADDDTEIPEQSAGKAEHQTYRLEVDRPEWIEQPLRIHIQDDAGNEMAVEKYAFRHPPLKYLWLDIGYHLCLDDPWSFQGEAQNFETARMELNTHLAQFDLSDVLVGMNDNSREAKRELTFEPVDITLSGEEGAQWLAEHGQLAEQRRAITSPPEGYVPLSQNVGPLSLLLNWRGLLLIFGVLGQCAMLSELLHSDKHYAVPVLIICCLPLLAWLADEKECETPRWQQIMRTIRTFAAAWALLLAFACLILIASGFHPKGVGVYVAFILAGCVPVMQILHGAWRNSRV